MTTFAMLKGHGPGFHGWGSSNYSVDEKCPDKSPGSSTDAARALERRTWENGQLRQQLQYQQRKNEASVYLLSEVTKALGALQEAIVQLDKVTEDIWRDNGNASPTPFKQRK